MESIDKQIVKVNTLIFECSKHLGKDWTSEMDEEIKQNIHHLEYLIKTELNGCNQANIEYILDNLQYKTDLTNSKTYCLINSAYIIPYIELFKQQIIKISSRVL
jgi:hypothetical protein